LVDYEQITNFGLQPEALLLRLYMHKLTLVSCSHARLSLYRSTNLLSQLE